MVKEDVWLGVEEVQARLTAAGYESHVKDDRLHYRPKGAPCDTGSFLIHNAEYGNGIDEVALLRVEAKEV